MNTYNTTYNFNQGNMNFGQALMYGAFGSLTGGMGCFGGYGMGMGGSLFSMMGMGMGGYGCGFGGFGMGCYSDSMIGMQVGSSIMQYAMYGISRAIEGRGAAKAEKNEKLNAAKSNVQALNKEISKLENENKGLKNPVDSDGNVTKEAELACPTEANAYTSAKELLDEENKKSINSYTNSTITGLEKELNDLKAKKEKTDPAPTEEELKQLEAKIEEIENPTTGKLVKAKEKAKSDAVEQKQQACKKANDDLELAARKKFNENKKKIDDLEADKTESQEIIDEAVNEVQVKNNNKNSKLEAKCDAQGIVDDNKEIEDQTTAQSKFNKAYEIFKSNQTKENFDILKAKYNEIQGNKDSFKKLMKHIISQHPDFDKTDIDW